MLEVLVLLGIAAGLVSAVGAVLLPGLKLGINFELITQLSFLFSIALGIYRIGVILSNMAAVQRSRPAAAPTETQGITHLPQR